MMYRRWRTFCILIQVFECGDSFVQLLSWTGVNWFDSLILEMLDSMSSQCRESNNRQPHGHSSVWHNIYELKDENSVEKVTLNWQIRKILIAQNIHPFQRKIASEIFISIICCFFHFEFHKSWLKSQSYCLRTTTDADTYARKQQYVKAFQHRNKCALIRRRMKRQSERERETTIAVCAKIDKEETLCRCVWYVFALTLPLTRVKRTQRSYFEYSKRALE